MNATSAKGAIVIVIALIFVLIRATSNSQTNSASSGQATITVSPTVPSDITSPINLQSAAQFAWQEFIALNWPAVQQTGALNNRDNADASKKFGDSGYAGPLVWHTYRSKVEIYPGTGNPPGYVNDPSKSYGYDALPQYVYAPTSVGTSNGMVPPAKLTSDKAPPWINLDEDSEIGLDTMYAGIGPSTPLPGKQILFLAKGNRKKYNYIAANQWWASGASGKVPRDAAIKTTAAFIANQKQDPPPGSPSNVSFPNGTIEIKAAWRLLGPKEDPSHFYRTTVRYYVEQGDGHPGYVDVEMALVGLHIIQKTPSAPFFVWATFSQTDNLLSADGKPIEDLDGNLESKFQNLSPYEVPITMRPATSASPANPDSIQHFSPTTSNADPQSRIYFINTPTTPTPPPTVQGQIAVNRRMFSIPSTIINVNRAAHAAITAYNQSNGISSSPWLYYKLINVQYQPYDKEAGTTYLTRAPGGPEPSTYYAGNEVIETDYHLQVFSGKLQKQLDKPYDNVNIQKLITDFNNDGTPVKNTYYNKSAYNMGGCMGCHGNIQKAGADFSFIFMFGPVSAPDTVGKAGNPAKFRRLFLSRSN
jgi:hypothetical protein